MKELLVRGVLGKLKGGDGEGGPRCGLVRQRKLKHNLGEFADISAQKRSLFNSCSRPYLLACGLKNASKITAKPLSGEVWGKTASSQSTKRLLEVWKRRTLRSKVAFKPIHTVGFDCLI